MSSLHDVMYVVCMYVCCMYAVTLRNAINTTRTGGRVRKLQRDAVLATLSPQDAILTLQDRLQLMEVGCY